MKKIENWTFGTKLGGIVFTVVIVAIFILPVKFLVCDTIRFWVVIAGAITGSTITTIIISILDRSSKS
jgi:hypothetical protein